MSFNPPPQYPARNFRKRRASNSNDRLAASDQSSVSIDRSLPQWHGTVTNGAHVESSHEDTLSPSAASYATNLHLPETSFYDFGPPANSYADRIPVDTSGFGWNTMPPVDPYPFPCQAFLDDPSARALPQVPTVPSQRRENIRELALTTETRYRGDQQGQTLPSALPSHLASRHTTSEAFFAPSVFSENSLLDRISSFTTAAQDNSENQRSSCSMR